MNTLGWLIVATMTEKFAGSLINFSNITEKWT